MCVTSPPVRNCQPSPRHRSGIGHRRLIECSQIPCILPCNPVAAPWDRGGWVVSCCAQKVAVHGVSHCPACDLVGNFVVMPSFEAHVKLPHFLPSFIMKHLVRTMTHWSPSWGCPPWGCPGAAFSMQSDLILGVGLRVSVLMPTKELTNTSEGSPGCVGTPACLHSWTPPVHCSRPLSHPCPLRYCPLLHCCFPHLGRKQSPC